MSNASKYLRRIAFIILIAQGSISATAQQNWFLFIQSESSQSFYVRIGETIYSSSPVGHLVINGLHDSTYRLAIGFPQSQFREQLFSIPVKRKDLGFELKKSDGRSWVLYDWQTQETIRSPRSDSLLFGERKKDDGFASLMAAVVNDSAVLYASVVKTEPPKKTEVVKKTDSLAKDTAVAQLQKNIDSAKTETASVKPVTSKPDTVTQEVPVKAAPKDTLALVEKLNEVNGSQEKKLVFLDNSIGIKKDTITVIIPIEKKNSKEALMDSVAISKKADSTGIAAERMREKIKADSIIRVEEEKRNADSIALVQSAQLERRKTDSIALVETEKRKADSIASAQASKKETDSIAAAKAQANKVDSTATVRAEMKKNDSSSITQANDPAIEKPANLVMVNSDCVKFATVHDVDKLRIKMMNEKDAGNRIFIAHKVFKNMCFATRQIKSLSELFPNDELRFRFFETAWPFISDTVEFKTLEETLTDSFFITRFRTLLRRQ